MVRSSAADNEPGQEIERILSLKEDV